MKALVGLGNPGQQYARTRHNAGRMLLDRLAERGKVLERRDKEWVQLEKLKLGPDSLWLVRPVTYMNVSGLGVAQACKSLQLEPGDVMVAYDEIDLPLGALRLKRGGGSAGHRGVESVIGELGSDRFPRLRLGVRGEKAGRDTASYVLSEFEPAEESILEEMIDRAVAAVRMTLRRGVSTAMNTYNRKPETETEPRPDNSEPST